MAIKKPTTLGEGEVLAGPPAEGPTPTVPVGDPVPETLNLTGSTPDEPVKSVALVSPWGTKVTVAADDAKKYRDDGYTK